MDARRFDDDLVNDDEIGGQGRGLDLDTDRVEFECISRGITGRIGDGEASDGAFARGGVDGHAIDSNDRAGQLRPVAFDFALHDRIEIRVEVDDDRHETHDDDTHSRKNLAL